jgi:hypothetical protein
MSTFTRALAVFYSDLDLNLLAVSAGATVVADLTLLVRVTVSAHLDCLPSSGLEPLLTAVQSAAAPRPGFEYFYTQRRGLSVALF